MHHLSEQSIQEYKQHLKTGSEALGIRVSQQQSDQMTAHATELMVWNKKINLTAIKDPGQMAEKHFIDSIAAAVFLEHERSVMDIGSGGGFPGIPLKIMNPCLKVVLIDSSLKKINFLKHVIRKLQLTDIDAIHSRIEDLHENEAFKNRFDAVISRALTDLSSIVALAVPLLNQTGKIYAMKGKHALEEITPSIYENFDIKTDHYQLPFEKSDRYMIRLSVKSEDHQPR